MASKGGIRILLAAMVACLLAVAPYANAAVDCETVKTQLTPCVGYVQGIDPVPAPGCCQGINNLIPLGRTTADRQQICVCLNELLPTVSGLIPTKVTEVLQKCGFNFFFPIQLPIDCSRYIIPRR
ncbi:unnamed protein product [Spirodela intermedia]|uniref:Non-specific lipid-transfer protein n=1 Tax=Spirodela intermedia TaxID=51605 RepID=A0A7I8LAC8_SPIIN|nr:unnamed protein product [Spirodela intermedia]